MILKLNSPASTQANSINHVNIHWFIAKLILNHYKIFKIYAKHLVNPLNTFML